MNSYSDACMAILSDNIETIFKALHDKSRYTSDMCQSMNLCDIQIKVR